MGTMEAAPRVGSDVTRASLFLRLQQDGPGREVAWNEFYDLYAPIISGFARRVGGRGVDVDDLVQEVLRAFFSASPEFSYDPARGRFRGYLKTCVANKLRELNRKRSLEITGLERAPDPADETVEAVWDDVWETEKLHRAVSVVRERYASNAERQRTFRAFEMCTLLDLSTEEVARQLDLTQESVRAAKSRVSKALRQAFDELNDIVG